MKHEVENERLACMCVFMAQLLLMFCGPKYEGVSSIWEAKASPHNNVTYKWWLRLELDSRK